MRTTLDIDEDVLQVAKELAKLRRTTVGVIISEMARKSMRPARRQQSVRNGVPLLPTRKDARLVTLETVNALRDEEGL